MKNKISRELLKLKADTLTESEVEEVLEYINIMESLHQDVAVPDPLDEMILGLLSETLEIETAKPGVGHQGRNNLKN